MSRQKELAKNTAILAIGKICTQCISFFLLPLYTAVLDTSEYGLYDLYVTYIALLLPIVNWQFDQGIFRYMLDCRGNQKRQTTLLSTVMFANIVQSVLYICIFGVANIYFGFQHSSFLLISVISNVFCATLLQFCRGLGYNTKYAVASFISASSTVAFNVIALVVIKKGIVGLFISNIMGQAMAILYLIFTLRIWKYFSVKSCSYSTFKEIRNYSAPLITNNLSWWVINVSDRTIISKILGVAANGVYSVANKFPSVFIQLYNIFNLSWTEMVSLHYQDEDRDVFLSETMTALFHLFSAACLGVIAIMPFIFDLLVNVRYSSAYQQIPILMIAMLCRVVVGLFSVIYIAQKKSAKIAQTSLASAVINIVVNLLLIGKIGVYAASISTLVAFAVLMIIRYIDVNKTVRLRISWLSIITTLLLTLIIFTTYYLDNFWLNIVGLLVTVVYAFYFNKAYINVIIRKLKRKTNI